MKQVSVYTLDPAAPGNGAIAIRWMLGDLGAPCLSRIGHERGHETPALCKYDKPIYHFGW